MWIEQKRTEENRRKCKKKSIQQITKFINRRVTQKTLYAYTIYITVVVYTDRWVNDEKAIRLFGDFPLGFSGCGIPKEMSASFARMHNSMHAILRQLNQNAVAWEVKRDRKLWQVRVFVITQNYFKKDRRICNWNGRTSHERRVHY